MVDGTGPPALGDRSALRVLSALGDRSAPRVLPAAVLVTAVLLSAGLLAAVLPAGCDNAPDRPPDTAGASGGAGWLITVYYTAVQEYHSGAPTRVTGCPRLDCANGTADLGTYPADFVRAVRDEGTGRTADGRYLNWSYDTGYWIDSVPRDTDGNPLRPYVSAAADAEVLARGTRFAVADCGRQDDGSAPPPDVCARLRAARWQVVDAFTPGLGGRRHVDVYIGEETGPGFTGTDAYVTLAVATLRIG